MIRNGRPGNGGSAGICDGSAQDGSLTAGRRLHVGGMNFAGKEIEFVGGHLRDLFTSSGHSDIVDVFVPADDGGLAR